MAKLLILSENDYMPANVRSQAYSLSIFIGNKIKPLQELKTVQR